MEEGAYIVNDKERRPSSAVKGSIKTLFKLMLDYAFEFVLVEQNYSRNFKLSKDVVKKSGSTKNKHIHFTDDEMKLLWEHVSGKRYVDVLLIQCYSG